MGKKSVWGPTKGFSNHLVKSGTISGGLTGLYSKDNGIGERYVEEYKMRRKDKEHLRRTYCVLHSFKRIKCPMYSRDLTRKGNKNINKAQFLN